MHLIDEAAHKLRVLEAEEALDRLKDLNAREAAGLLPPGPTGPRTPAGKRRSSLNATRHCLTGQIVIFTQEEAVAFDKHCAATRQALAAIGHEEDELAQAIAEDRWRLKRARALENSIFAQGHQDHVAYSDSGNAEVDAALAQATTWKQQAKSLHLLTIYEQRINRALEKNTARLELLRSNRQAAFEKAQAEALLLTELAQSKGETYHPAADFPSTQYFGEFIYASAEIARLLSRQSRLEEALARRGASRGTVGASVFSPSAARNPRKVA
jgi:hypothetical protein